MYNLNSKLFAHEDYTKFSDAVERVERIEAAMGKQATRFGNDDIPDLIASNRWAELRATRFGEQSDPPDPDDQVSPSEKQVQPIQNEGRHRKKPPSEGATGAHVARAPAMSATIGLLRNLVVNALDIPVHAKQLSIVERLAFCRN